MTQVLQMKMAKAGRDELDEFARFCRQVELIEDYSFRNYSSDEFKENGDPEMCLIEDTVNGGVETTQWLEAWLPFLSSGSLFRILGGYQTMLMNACDPNADTLEWKPEIAKALTSQDR